METTASNLAASTVFIVLYLLALLTVAQLLIGFRFKLPEKLQWIRRIPEVPLFGPVACWVYVAVTGKKKEKHDTPPNKQV